MITLKVPSGYRLLDWYKEDIQYFGCMSVCLRNLIKPSAIQIADHTYAPYSGDLVADNGGKDAIFEKLREHLSKNNILVIMSGIGNNDQNQPQQTGHHHGEWSVAGFVDWLKTKGEYIIATPWLTNTMHMSNAFSVRRGWFWMPKDAPGVAHIADTATEWNRNAGPFLSEDEWFKKYQDKFPRFDLSKLHG